MLKSKGPKTDPCGIAVMPRAKRTANFSSFFTIIQIIKYSI